MVTHQDWRSRTALLMALGLTSTAAMPLLMATSVAAEPLRVAQLFSQPRFVGVEAGTVIPVRYDEAEKIVVLPDETAPLTLTVANDVRTARGTVVIAAGTQVEGELQPVTGGTQFVAQNLVTSTDRRLPIDAVSDIITETETISEESDPDFLRGASIGAAAGAVLAEVLGDIDVLDVLLGAGLGALGSVIFRGDKEVEVVVVYPETDLDLTLQSDFRLP